MALVLCSAVIGATGFGAAPSHAAGLPDNKGTDFWLAFTENPSAPSLKLFITGETPATGTVSSAAFASIPFAVTPGTVTTVVIPVAAQLTGSDVIQNKGIRVVADAEVTVYGLNQAPATTDAFLGLPVDVLGTEYLVLTYKASFTFNGPQFGVVATANGTVVTITPSQTVGSRAAGVPYTITLDAGQTYQLRRSGIGSDLSGTVITSSQPVAVFAGDLCGNVPAGVTFCDHLVEQLPPVTTMGKNFVANALATRTKGDTFRFLASTDGTQVSVNGTVVATLDRGQVHEMTFAAPTDLHVTSTQPIFMAQFSNGTSFDGVVSDPFMLLVPPAEQFQAGYTVVSLGAPFTANFINVLKTSDGSVSLDGAPISVPFVPIGTSGFSGAQVPVAPGSHNLTGSLPFGAFVYGFGPFDSYGYAGGASFAPIAVATNLLLQPPTATNQVNTQHCVTATVTDQNDAPLNGIRVDFAVTGAHNLTGFQNTDLNGRAQFCYTGLVGGTDTIRATAGTLSATAQKIWLADTIAPTTSASANPPANANGWNNTDVTVTLSAVDNPGGSGVALITYTLSGAQTGTGSVSGATTAVTISAEGITTVTFQARDNANNVEALQTTVIRIDKTPPVIDPVSGLTLEATSPAGAVATYAPTATDATSGVVSVSSAPASGSTFPIGVTTVTVTATDSAGNSSTKIFTVTVQDTTPPALTVPGAITKEATAPLTSVTLGAATAVDLVDGPVTVSNNAPAGGFPVGTTTVTWTAVDSRGNRATATQSVTITDTTAPTVSLNLTPGLLWPPNHKLVTITPTLVVSDLAGPVTISDPTVSSNEPIDGLGDGDTSPDWIITGTNGIQLRAERSGAGNGRTYTITYVVTDRSGNAATVSATVLVPKSQGR